MTPTPDLIELKFNRGLNGTVDSFSCSDGNCLTFADYQFDYGILHPRTSMFKLNITNQLTGKGVRGIYYWCAGADLSTYPQGRFYLLGSDTGTGTGTFYRSSVYTGVAPGTLTLTDITGGITQPTFVSGYASLNGILLVAGPAAAPFQIAGSGVNCTAVTTPNSNFSLLRTVGNFMFGSPGLLGTGPTDRDAVYWSNVNDPTTWGTSNLVDFRKNDGDCVTAFGELNGNLLIFKQRSIGMLSTTTQIISGAVTLAPLTTLFLGIGTFAPWTTDNLPDGRCIFLASDLNVYVTDGSTLDSLTNNAPNGPNIIDLTTTTQSRTYGNGYNQVFLKYFHKRNEIVLFLGNVIYVFDVIQKYWRKITGNSTSLSLCEVLNTATTPSDIVYGNENGFIVSLANANNSTPTDDSGTSAGAAVTPNASTSVVLPPNYIQQGYMWLTIIYSSSNAVTYTYGFDGTYKSNQTLSASNKRADIKILFSGSTNFQIPSTFQLKFVDTGGANIYRCFLSKEGTS